MKEYYNKNEGDYYEVELNELPEEEYYYDEITQETIIATPSYTFSEIQEVKEQIVERLPLGGEIYEIENKYGLLIHFKDHMSDYHFYKMFQVQTNVPAHEIRELCPWCKPLDYNPKKHAEA